MADLHHHITIEHARLKAKGIDYPEIHIDKIWKKLLDMVDLTLARKFAVEFEMIVNPVYPMPNMVEVIHQLRKKNLSIGIISNAQFYTPLLFDLFYNCTIDQLGFLPDLTFYSFEFGYAKPSTKLFNAAREKLLEKGIEPEEVIYVGNDMLKDIYPAHLMKFQTCLFAGDKRSLRLRTENHKCANIKPDAVITDLSQLVFLLN